MVEEGKVKGGGGKVGKFGSLEVGSWKVGKSEEVIGW